MANFKTRISGYNKLVINNTEIDRCQNNFVIFTIDIDKKNINYTISRSNLIYFLNKLSILYEEDKTSFSIKEVISILKDDIFSIYKTKISQKRIPQILMNILICNKLIKSDDGIDFFLISKKTQYIKYVNNI